VPKDGEVRDMLSRGGGIPDAENVKFIFELDIEVRPVCRCIGDGAAFPFVSIHLDPVFRVRRCGAGSNLGFCSEPCPVVIRNGHRRRGFNGWSAGDVIRLLQRRSSDLTGDGVRSDELGLSGIWLCRTENDGTH